MNLTFDAQLDQLRAGKLDPAALEVSSPSQAQEVGEDYVLALTKVIASHVINEIVGAKTFDEPAIALAESPRDKFLACRIAMEEYGHHLDFSKLARGLKVAPERLDHSRALSIFKLDAPGWLGFLSVKALTDFTEIIQLEDLLDCTYAPLRKVAEKGMIEEKFHVGFGWGGLRKELAEHPDRKDAMHDALSRVFVGSLPLFGRSDSRNNERYRRWGVKLRSNRDMRGDYVLRVQELIARLGLDPLEVPVQFQEDVDGFLADGGNAKRTRARQAVGTMFDDEGER